MIQRIAILGVGLIGGSLGLAWKRSRPDLRITGFDAPDVLEQAASLGIVDEKAATARHAVREADLVVLAAPIGANLRLLEEIGPHLRSGALVTDVSSVKKPITEHARLFVGPENLFAGGHPMAGAEYGGVAHADAFLFENATYVICPPEEPSGEDAGRYDAFLRLVEETGARILLLDAERHDRIAAAVSHLPQLLAVALMNHAAEGQAHDEAFLNLAAGGFRDMTRIASSPFRIWRDILLANQGAVLDALGRFTSLLRTLRNRLIEEDLGALEDAFERARTLRETIPRDTKGFLHPLADVFVYVEDQPGALFGITRTLFEAEISIKDIELLKIREGTGGTFRLGFADETTAEAARDALERAGYRAHRL
ncbi:prephenate dehydrogenase/arogenate dehydrogenase family protein [Rhodocaloribacter sp.]